MIPTPTPIDVSTAIDSYFQEPTLFPLIAASLLSFLAVRVIIEGVHRYHAWLDNREANRIRRIYAHLDAKLDTLILRPHVTRIYEFINSIDSLEVRLLTMEMITRTDNNEMVEFMQVLYYRDMVGYLQSILF